MGGEPLRIGRARLRRQGVVAALTILAVSAVPAAPASGSTLDVGMPAPPTASREEGPSDEAILEAARAGRERRRAREEWLRGSAARDVRVRSRSAHRGLSAGESRSLLVETFGELLDGLTSSASELARSDGFLEFFDDHTARVRTPQGPRVLRSLLPLRVADSDGDKQPVDLSLLERSGGFEPATPLVPVSLPGSLAAPIRIGSDRLGVHVESSNPSSPAGRDGPERLFYADADTDTDVVLLPVEVGVEAMWQIRSPASPERFGLRFELPEGSRLERQESGAIDVRRAGETLATVRPAQVVDAQGEQVKSTTSIDGDRVVFDVKHRDADVAYPLALDPVVEQHWWSSGESSGMLDWAFGTNAGIKFGGYYSCWWGNPCFSQSSLGLHVDATDNDYWAGENGYFQYTAPGITSYISRADFQHLAFQWRGQCCANAAMWDGLWDPYRGWTAYHDTSSQTWGRADTVWAGPGTRSASFGEVMLSYGRRTPITVAYLGAVALYLDDPEAPRITTTVNPNLGWVREGAVNVWAASYDPGLGIRRTGITGRTGLPSSVAERTISCTGTKTSACRATEYDDWTFSTANLPEGSNTLTVFAEDAVGHRGTQPVTVNVDRVAPKIALSGPLYDHRDRPLNESDTYPMHVRALDPECAVNGQRSGVRSVSIQVDGQTVSTQNSALGTCVFEFDWTFQPKNHPGSEHAITVKADDHASNVGTRVLRPIYVGPPGQPALDEPVEGLAAAAGLVEEDIEAIKSPRPDLMPIWRGDVLPGKGYFGSGFTRPRVAVGGGRVYVATGSGGVKAFDASDPAGKPSQTISTAPASGGIAYYRDRVYAVGPKRIDVFDPDGSSPPRQIGAGACRDGTVGTAGATLQPACDAAQLGLNRPQGLDAAWGKLFVADEIGGANGRVVRVYAADTGIPLGVSPMGTAYSVVRDVSVAPDQGLYFDANQASAWLAGASIPWLNSGPTLDQNGTVNMSGTWCVCGFDGTDWVWGMNWLLGTTYGSNRIEEYGPSVRKRSWAAKQSTPVTDVAYHKRETRLEASGNLVEHNWINHDQQLFYVASDADIFIMGPQGEHWYEQARNLTYVELKVDGQNVPFSVNGDPAAMTSSRPAGQLTLDTHSISSGAKHNLELIAHFSDRDPLKVDNDDLKIDHAAPTGTIGGIGPVVREGVSVTGNLEDPHSGPLDWRLQVRPAGQASWADVSSCDAIAAPGPYACNWNTRAHEDGHYQVRAQLTDRIDEKHRNVGGSNQIDTIVDNHAPTVAVDGPLWTRGRDRQFVYHDETVPLNISAADPASGVGAVEVQVDGVVQARYEQTCDLGGCSLARDYGLRAADFRDGAHAVRVVVTDVAGWTTELNWTVTITKPPPEAVDPTELSDDTSDDAAESVPDWPNDGTTFTGPGSTSWELRCSSPDEPLVTTIPEYSRPFAPPAAGDLSAELPSGFSTPDLALAAFLASTVSIPRLPLHLFTQLALTTEGAVYGAIVAGDIRTVVALERTGSGWEVVVLHGCSDFVYGGFLDV